MTKIEKKAANAARQAKFRAQAAANGWVQCNVWVPAHAVPELQLQAEIMRANPHLVAGPLRDPHSGKLVALRAPRICKAA